jgi:hypothetical protein
MEGINKNSAMSLITWFSRGLFLACLCLLTACSNTVMWEEEVELSDGRIIVVTQKKRCEGGDYAAKTGASCVARESWLTIRLAEFSDKDILWHESLDPMVLNVHQGRLYVVGRPPHTLEFRAYGATNPPYFGFVWEQGVWRRLRFAEIPESIYERNMLTESIPQTRTNRLTLAVKNSEAENGNTTYPSYLRRIDPAHTTSAY